MMAARSVRKRQLDCQAGPHIEVTIGDAFLRSRIAVLTRAFNSEMPLWAGVSAHETNPGGRGPQDDTAFLRVDPSSEEQPQVPPVGLFSLARYMSAMCSAIAPGLASARLASTTTVN
jgi:hypothetical protein